jgi:hypothetical protein
MVTELFPRYAPDLNPVDKIWFYVKFDRLANFAPPRLADLRDHVEAELCRLQRHPQILHDRLRGQGPARNRKPTAAVLDNQSARSIVAW